MKEGAELWEAESVLGCGKVTESCGNPRLSSEFCCFLLTVPRTPPASDSHCFCPTRGRDRTSGAGELVHLVRDRRRREFLRRFAQVKRAHALPVAPAELQVSPPISQVRAMVTAGPLPFAGTIARTCEIGGGTLGDPKSTPLNS